MSNFVGYKPSPLSLAIQGVKNVFKSRGKKVSQDIKSVKPNVPKTEYDKAFRDLKIAVHKAKGQKAKTDQTIFEFKNPKFKGEKFTFDSSKKKAIKKSDRKKGDK